MKKIKINDVLYELQENKDECFILDEIANKLTDYFDDFDYIFGDYAYDKVRLKGFLSEDNKKVKDINNIKNLEKYKSDFCSYGCKYFLLKKVK